MPATNPSERGFAKPIAFVEYCFQVPANRIGHLYLKEPLKWNYVVGFALIAFGAVFVFAPWQQTPAP